MIDVGMVNKNQLSKAVHLSWALGGSVHTLARDAKDLANAAVAHESIPEAQMILQQAEAKMLVAESLFEQQEALGTEGAGSSLNNSTAQMQSARAVLVTASEAVNERVTKFDRLFADPDFIQFMAEVEAEQAAEAEAQS